MSRLSYALFIFFSASRIAVSETTPTSASGVEYAYPLGVYTGTALVLDNLTTPFKAFSDYGAQNQGWMHTARFLMLTVGNAQDRSEGKTYDVKLTMTGRGALTNSGTAALDNPAFVIWTSGTTPLTPEQVHSQHSWNPTRGPNENAINISGAADQLNTNDGLRLAGVLNDHVGWIGYVNAGPSYVLENTEDPVTLEPQTASGQKVLDTVTHGALNAHSKLWLTKPALSTTAYSNNYFLQGTTMQGSSADFASMTLYGLKAGYYLIATGGACPTTSTPKTVCGIGTQYRFSVEPIVPMPTLTPGFKFTEENAIPEGSDLTAAFNRLTDTTLPGVLAIDLQQEVLNNTPSLLQQLKALPQLASASVAQTITGTLLITKDHDSYALTPVKVFKTTIDKPGLSVTADGQISLVTDNARRIVLNSSLYDSAAFKQTSSNLGLSLSAVDSDYGVLTLSPTDNNVYYQAQALAKSETATVSSQPGLYLAPYLTDKVVNVTAAYWVLRDAQGQLRQQVLVPAPVDWPGLRNALETLLFKQIRWQDGVISVTDSSGKVYQGMLTYPINSISTNNTTVNLKADSDVNQDGQPDLLVQYPNGKQQTLIVFK